MKEQPQPAGPCSPRLGEGRCVPLDGAPRVEAVNPLAPLGALHRRHVEIAQRARVVVRMHGLIEGLVAPIADRAFQQYAADETDGFTPPAAHDTRLPGGAPTPRT